MKKRHHTRPEPFSPRIFDVEGSHAVAEYLRFRPEAVKHIRYKTDAALAPLQELIARQAEAKPQSSAIKLTRHPEASESICAHVMLSPIESHTFLSRIDTRTRDIVVALDHITDPHNLGAIVRSAAFFGVLEIVVPERRQVLLTKASVSTAQGGFAKTDLVCVVNLRRTLDAMKERGYWIVGTSLAGEPASAVAKEYKKTVLVMGSEDRGISRNVLDACDRIVTITRHGDGIESLNVSVAAGILMNDFQKRPTVG